MQSYFGGGALQLIVSISYICDRSLEKFRRKTSPPITLFVTRERIPLESTSKTSNPIFIHRELFCASLTESMANICQAILCDSEIPFRCRHS